MHGATTKILESTVARCEVTAVYLIEIILLDWISLMDALV